MRLALSLLLVLFVSICWAQEDDVVIEATRFREEVRRLPASVTVLASVGAPPASSVQTLSALPASARRPQVPVYA